MDLATVSERILNENFGMEMVHSDTVPSSDISENSLTHYGILGMKWGVRRTPEQLGHKKKTKKAPGQKKGETSAQYNARMKREHEEKMAKIESKTRLKEQKMVLKSEQKRLKEEKKEAASTRDFFNPNNKTKPLKNMTDEELNAAINRARAEKEYLSLVTPQMNTKQKENVTKTSNSTVKKVAAWGGGILLAVGTQVVKKQLADVGNEKLEDYLVKKGIKKKKSSGKKDQKKEGDGD